MGKLITVSEDLIDNTGKYQTQNISFFPKKGKVERVVDGDTINPGFIKPNSSMPKMKHSKMILSSRLKTIFLLSIPVFIAHGIEEYITEFYNIDKFSRFVFSYTETMSPLQASFITFQIMIWILLIFGAIFITRPKWMLYIMIIPGLIYLFELHHLFKALISLNYYPGLITAILFPFIGFYYWKQLIKDWKRSK